MNAHTFLSSARTAAIFLALGAAIAGARAQLLPMTPPSNSQVQAKLAADQKSQRTADQASVSNGVVTLNGSVTM